MKQIDEAVQALACANRNLAAILDFVEETLKRKKIIYQANSSGPVCILQIFGNNPSRGFQVKAETSGSAKTISLHHHIVGGDLIKELTISTNSTSTCK